MRPLSQAELRHLSGLGPHTRKHAEQLLANVAGLVITSGKRSPERNREVGGVPGSKHLTGRAADFGGPRWSIEEAERIAPDLRVGARCTGPEFVLDEGDHLHVEW